MRSSSSILTESEVVEILIPAVSLPENQKNKKPPRCWYTETAMQKTTNTSIKGAVYPFMIP